MHRYSVKITGRTPLLLHHNNLAARDADSAGGVSGGRAGDDRFPPGRWKRCLYIFDGRLVMPVENIMASVLKVGSAIKVGGNKTLKEASQRLYFDSPFLAFRFSGRDLTEKQVDAIDGKFDEQMTAASKLGFELYVKPCRVNGKGHIRVRPRFNEWETGGEFEVEDEELTAERLAKLFDLAGTRSGLGDWRPGSPKRPGTWGMFRSELKAVG